MSVYFIQAEGGQIKIGRSDCPTIRLKTLETGSPVQLKLLKQISCDRKESKILEDKLHLKFKDCRLHGEWFHPTDELLKYIKNVPKIKLSTIQRRLIKASGDVCSLYTVIKSDLKVRIDERAKELGMTTQQLVKDVIEYCFK